MLNAAGFIRLRSMWRNLCSWSKKNSYFYSWSYNLERKPGWL